MRCKRTLDLQLSLKWRKSQFNAFVSTWQIQISMLWSLIQFTQWGEVIDLISLRSSLITFKNYNRSIVTFLCNSTLISTVLFFVQINNQMWTSKISCLTVRMSQIQTWTCGKYTLLIVKITRLAYSHRLSSDSSTLDFSKQMFNKGLN